MDIDWQNITIEFAEPQFQVQELDFSEFQAFPTENQMTADIPQQMTADIPQQMTADIPQQMTGEIYIEEIYYEEEQPNVQRNPKRKFDSIKEESSTLYYCNTCSLDFPSFAYLNRHNNTKKHQYGLQLEQRGRKFRQKRKYVRKGEVTPRRKRVKMDEMISTQVEASENVELLDLIDEQISQFQDEENVKDFCENFDFDLEMIDEKAEFPVEITTPEEILADLMKSKNEEFVTNQVQVPKVRQPIFKSNYPQQGTEVKKHYCFICNKTFNQQCHYTQHMNSVHAGNRNFKCEKCGKKYPEKYLLDNHMKKHFEENKKFKCEVCPRSYNNKVDLKRHEKTHQDVRDHVCKICGNGFVRFDHLQKHYAVHQKRMSMGLGDRIRSRRGLVAKQSVY